MPGISKTITDSAYGRLTGNVGGGLGGLIAQHFVCGGLSMNRPDQQDYYTARAAAARDLAQRAANPKVAAVHADFAARYDQLAAQPERQKTAALTGA